MRLLALDIGMKRTGVAFVDTENDIPLPLDTIKEDTMEGMLDCVFALVDARHIDEIIMGLPLLPSGQEGSQATYVRSCADHLLSHGITVTFLDERYTTAKTAAFDGDAKAACSLLEMYLERR